eukprot:TRINITY_DN4685_c0_g1_i1.p1 TRINITY_DN4685_c0_g1~~TRINITY_DN4685_c0_g1_i1.p1  ORF type:complete len:327 (-),score=43.89 TRINITY_DN4685_c0_g1_i1:1037-2017(-)
MESGDAPVHFAWEQVAEQRNAPKARSSHAMAAVGQKVFVFGGEFEPRVPIDNSVHVFDLDTKSWSIAPASGDIPSPRIGVAMASLGPVLYIFAGRNAAHEEMDELFSFDTESGVWTKLPWGAPHRSYHALAADPVRQQLYTFGGCSPSHGRLNDLWRYDCATKTWTACPPPPSACVPRGGPGLAVANDRVWVLFGFNGKSEQGDVHCYEISSEKWEPSEVAFSGPAKPSPRSVFAAVTLGSSIVVYGGELDPSDDGHMGAGMFSDETWVMNAETREWAKPVLEGSAHPGGRGWCPAAPLGDKRMLVYGGNSESNDRLDDMWILRLA